MFLIKNKTNPTTTATTGNACNDTMITVKWIRIFIYSNLYETVNWQDSNLLHQSAWPFDNPIPLWYKKLVPMTRFHGT